MVLNFSPLSFFSNGQFGGVLLNKFLISSFLIYETVKVMWPNEM